MSEERAAAIAAEMRDVASKTGDRTSRLRLERWAEELEQVRSSLPPVRAEGETATPAERHHINGLFSDLGVKDGATLQDVQRKLGVNTPNAMRLFSLHAAIRSIIGRNPVPVRAEAAKTPLPMQHVLIVSDYPSGGVRAVVTTQAGAEKEIAAIRRDHPDLTRSDFTVESQRVRLESDWAETAKTEPRIGVEHQSKDCHECWLDGKPFTSPVRADEPTEPKQWWTLEEVRASYYEGYADAVRNFQEEGAALPPVQEPPKPEGPGATRSHRFDCDECQVRGVVVDEDGCCKGCGHEARMVASPSQVVRLDDLKALVNEFRSLADQYRPLSASFAHAYGSAADRLSAALEGAATKGGQ